MGRRKCRLWWPSDLSSQAPPESSFLFGWFVYSSQASLDVIVAFACDEFAFSSTIKHDSDLQEILHRTNKNMPALLQDKCKFSLLGHYEAESSGNSHLVGFRNDKSKHSNLTSNRHHLNGCTSEHRSLSCGCPKLDVLLEQFRHSALENMWIKLVYDLSDTLDGQVDVLPKLDHVHWTRETLPYLDLHVIIYDIPTFGGHHYSLGIHDSFNQGTFCKKPKWFDDLHQKDPLLELDTVICAINSANAAQMLFGGQSESGFQFNIFCMLTTLAWELFSASVASLSTIIYIMLQSSHILCSWVSNSLIYVILAKVFSNTWQTIRIRCCQLLYWPILLQDHSMRHRSCVEFAEKSEFHKHSMWSNLVVDVLLGNLIGIPLWFMAEPTCLWLSDFAHDITNYLRNSCVWLIGNPAGFKVNTELAGILGIISLTAIQIWSTLWALMGFFFLYFTKGIALCGILFGLTAAAALVIDIISVVTLHVLSLHLFMSLLYSTQIQTVAALWRIFRGKKWNPLRHRLDSYDYTVEQHVVGCLLFTPISLLLPTTSAFYIFFTILHTAVCLICIVVGFVISFIHATPYAKIFLWLRRKERFPSGIWIEVISCQHSETEAVSDSNPPPPGTSSSKSTILVSFLHSNYSKLGEVVWPHYRYIFSGISRSAISSSAYGLLTGTSIQSSPRTGLPPKLPWITIHWKEYWRLCHDSVYACRGDPYSH